ncbi:MAG: hypothetical protein QGG40_00200 [Myxococcota bacterium]|nr:hypothetical protein [Myxococcota bacterium]
MELPASLLVLCRSCADAGGQAWLVGGRVRDELLDRPSKDLDVEVHGLSAERLEAVLSKLGAVNQVGRSFGVFKVRIDGVELDVSLPRRDSKRGPGHRGIQIQGDPHMGLQEAARRRDLTINAIAFDPLTGAFEDPHDGIRDIRERRLRAVDADTFSEDPLRALRVVQFAARFQFSVDEELATLCLNAALDELPPERIWGEWAKLLSRSERPSHGLVLARRLGVLDRVFPEAVCEASGDSAVDRAARLRAEFPEPGMQVALMLSAWLHRTPAEGVEATLDRLRVFRMGGVPVRDLVLACVVHVRLLDGPVTDAQLCTLADELPLGLLLRVARAIQGDEKVSDVEERVVRLGVADGPLPPLLLGRDLQRLGMREGPQVGQMLDHVRAEQLGGRLRDPEAARQWVQERLGESNRPTNSRD